MIQEENRNYKKLSSPILDEVSGNLREHYLSFLLLKDVSREYYEALQELHQVYNKFIKIAYKQFKE